MTQCHRRLLVLYTRVEEHSRALVIRHQLHPPARLERAAQQTRRCHSQHRPEGSRRYYRESANIYCHTGEAQLCDQGMVRTKVRHLPERDLDKMIYRDSG